MTLARRTSYLAAVALSVAGVFTSPVSAQQIAQDAKIAEGSLTAEQTQGVRDFVEAWMGRLISADPAEVTESRNAILREFRTPGITETFREAFSQEVSRMMGEAIQAESDLVRINAMIIATQLTNEGAEEFIDAGLSDSNAAVQYWSAKAYQERVDRATADEGPGMPAAEQRSVIGKVGAIFENSPSTPVARVGIEILSKLTVPEARAAMLSLLHDRVAYHAENPQASYLPEQTAIQLLSAEISRERRSDPNDIAELSRAAYRYFVQIHAQLEADNVLDGSVEGHKAMLDWCNKCLQALGAKVQADMPENVGEVNDWIRLDEWEDLGEVAAAWRLTLMGAPFNMTADDLD
ncbi:MAG: hypothetical protein ACIAXF_11830 [Phycisphaerales bacterium JB063]